MQSGVLAVPEIKKLLQEHQLLQSLVIAPKAEMFTKITSARVILDLSI